MKALTNSRVLIIDDHRNIRVSLRLALENEGAVVNEAESVADAKSKLGGLTVDTPAPYDLIFLDIRLPDGSGLDILQDISQANMASQVVMISGEGTVTEAFQATQMGAFDYIEKPFTPERILVSANRCLEFNQVQSENLDLNRQIQRGQEILGNHPIVKDMLERIKRIGPTQSRVLIAGESGTGKELVARALHRLSDRNKKPLIKINCAAIPHSLIESELFGHEKGSFTGAVKEHRGLFEQADGGTLFLDEIGELSLDVQAKLLRVLQSGEFKRVGSEKIISADVRLLTATHRDLSEMVEHQEFREDLFYRLNVVRIDVPPLRSRGDDIAALAQHFLQKACEENSIGVRHFGEQALSQLAAHTWPGNIRELQNIAERAAILSDEQIIDNIDEFSHVTNSSQATATSLPKDSSDQANLREPGEFLFATTVVPWQEFHGKVDKSYIKFVLRLTQGNVSGAARMLCLERAYLHRLMKKLGIQRDVVVSD